jgi:hypothetical protein
MHPADSIPTDVPADLCGRSASTQCAPKCCQGGENAQSVEELGEKIAAAFEEASAKAKSAGITMGEGLTAEDMAPPTITLSGPLQACQDAIDAGHTLVIVPGDVDQAKFDLIQKVLRNDPESILLEAERIVNGARRGSYGTPENNFGRIANLWSAYLLGKPGGPLPITPQDTSLMMILMKVARLLETPEHRDSIVDIAGYAACVETLWVEQAVSKAKLADEL